MKKAGTVGDALGIAGDVLTVGCNIYENNYNPETQSFEVTPKSAVNTVTDVAIDIGFGAAAASAGAAIGSCFLPPVGTIVGAGAGVAIGFAIEADIADWDGDGQKDSLVDGAKMVVDSAVDWLWDKFSW